MAESNAQYLAMQTIRTMTKIGRNINKSKTEPLRIKAAEK
jgi:hypothetical protein